MGELKRAQGSGVPNLGIDVDKNDIIAIAVSRAETELNRVVADHTKLAKDTEKMAQGIKTGLEEEIKARLDAAAKNDVETILGGFKNRGLVLHDHRVHTIDLDAGRGKLTVSFRTTSDNNYNNGYFPTSDELIFTPEQKARAARYKELLEQVAADRAEIVNARRKLTQMGTLERQIRGSLAEEALRGVEGGDALLAVITGDLQERIKALPGV